MKKRGVHSHKTGCKCFYHLKYPNRQPRKFHTRKPQNPLEPLRPLVRRMVMDEFLKQLNRA